jgi:hypothetical protein
MLVPKSKGGSRVKAISTPYRLKSLAKFVIGLVFIPVTVTLLLTGPVAAAPKGHDRSDGLAAVRAATARYHSLVVAQNHNYNLFTDAAKIACIDNPGVGAMGVHYVNLDLVTSGKIDALRPQALVYQPENNGQLRLVAVEYIAFQQQWDDTHQSPPMLFGQHFMLTPAGNRFGIPAFYSLHAWIWKFNPSGTFAMWNPLVTCNVQSAA